MTEKPALDMRSLFADIRKDQSLTRQQRHHQHDVLYSEGWDYKVKASPDSVQSSINENENPSHVPRFLPSVSPNQSGAPQLSFLETLISLIQREASPLMGQFAWTVTTLNTIIALITELLIHCFHLIKLYFALNKRSHVAISTCNFVIPSATCRYDWFTPFLCK
jgi:hypothetical protein